jgi:hypothetical protein
MMTEYEVSMTFSNGRESSISLILEPWGEIYPIEPHMKLTICFNSLISPSSPNAIEVEYGVDQMIVYGWEGCTATLFQNAEALDSGVQPRPHVPQGIEILKKMSFFEKR